MCTISRLWFASAKLPNTLKVANKAEWLGLSAIIALGASLRWWSKAMKSDLWYDEVYSYVVAGRSFTGMIDTLFSGADTNPPLYTVLLHYWLWLGTSDTHVKCLSLLFAISSIGIMYALARRMFGRQVALLSSLLFATSQSVITYGVEARPYAQFLFLSLLSTYLLLVALQTAGHEQTRGQSYVRLWFGYSAVTTLTIYTHWFGLLVVLVQAGALIIYFPRSRSAVRAYSICLLTIAICCLPLALFLRNQIALQHGVGGYTWPGKPGFQSVANLAAFFAGDKNLLALICLILAIAWLSRRKRSVLPTGAAGRHIIFLATYLLAPVFIVLLSSNLLASSSFFVNRYFLPFIISLPIALGLALTRLPRGVASLLIVVFVLSPVWKSVKHSRDPEIPYSRAAAELSLRFQRGGLIAHLSPMSYYPVAHYLKDVGVTQKILCDRAGAAYEIAYNLRGGMLSPDVMIEVGEDLHKFTDFWLVIDPVDKDRRLSDAYDYIRNDPDFVLESQIQIKALRLEHYVLRAFEASRLGDPHSMRPSASSESSP